MVRFIGPDNDAYVASVARHIDEFEELTGQSAILEIIPETDYVTNSLDALRARLTGESAPDIYVSGPVSMWKLAGEGLVEPLDDYIANASLSYDPDDFLPQLLESNRWTGRRGDALGTGPLLEIPVNWETYNLAYLPEVLERAGLSEPPATWEEYFAAAERIAERVPGVRGFAQRGTDTWHTMYTGFATQFWSYGAADFDENGRSAIASPSALAATRDFLDAVRASGPTAWPDGHWLERGSRLRRRTVRSHCRLRSLRRLLREPGVRRAGPGRIRAAACGPRRSARGQHVDLVTGDEQRVSGQAGRLEVHRVGELGGIPHARGFGGQHEPDAAEHTER